MSEFDPRAFLDTSIDEPLETKYPIIPKGEYLAVCDDVKEPRPAGDSWVVDVVYEILDDEVRKTLNRDKVTARMSLFLDIENGRLATGTGRNVKLGRVLAAHGLNAAGSSLRQLKGSGPVKVTIDHRASRSDPETVYSEIVAVAPAA